MLIRRLTALILLLAPGSAFAARVEFAAQRGGERIAGAEVCFWRGVNSDVPLESNLASDDVRCVSADDVLDLPAGHWLYFVRHASDAVSVETGSIDNPNPRLKEAGYKQFVVEMQPAATLDVSSLRTIHPDALLAAYVSNEGNESRPSLVPIPRGAKQFTIPARTHVILLALKEGRVIDVTAPVVLDAGAARSIDSFRSGGALVAWVTFPRSARIPGEHWKAMPAPNVQLHAADRKYEPVVPLRAGYGSDGAMLLFCDLSPGPWTLRIGGDAWSSDEVEGSGDGASLQIVRPLRTGPNGTVDVRWSAVAIAPAIRGDCAGTAEPKDLAHAFGFRLLFCNTPATLEARLVPLNQCRAVAEIGEAAARARTVRISPVAPGTYLTEVLEPGYPPQRRTINVVLGRTTTIVEDLRPFEVLGRVTVGHEPFAGRIEFSTGSAQSDADGRYHAKLFSPPYDPLIRVATCDGARIGSDLPDHAIVAGETYDIDIPRNRLLIDVVDAATSAPLDGADVWAGIEDDSGGHFLEGIERTAEKGRWILRNVPADREITVCGKAQGFQQACADRFQMRGEEEHVARLVVHQVTTHSGRLVSAQTPARARVYFVAANGATVTECDVRDDGTFVAEGDLRPAQYVVIASANLPLVVAPFAQPGDGELAFTMPQNGVDIDVRIGERNSEDDALIELRIGDRHVPAGALFRHQTFRGLQPMMRGKGPFHIPSVAKTGLIQVRLGPSAKDMPREQAFADVFLRPELVAGRPMMNVPADGHVLFP